MAVPYISLDQGRLILENTPQGYKDIQGNLYTQSYGAQGSGYYAVPTIPAQSVAQPAPTSPAPAPGGAIQPQNQPPATPVAPQPTPTAPTVNLTPENVIDVLSSTGKSVESIWAMLGLPGTWMGDYAHSQQLANAINAKGGIQSLSQIPTTPTTPTSGYSGPSIVDYLNSVGKPSDFTSRSQLAQQSGIQNYTGTAQQNTQLLNQLRSQGGGKTTPQPQAPQPQAPQPQAPEPQAPEPQAPEPQAPQPQAPEPQAPEPQAPPGTTPAPGGISESATAAAERENLRTQVRDLMKEFGISPISPTTNNFSALIDYLNQVYSNLGLTDLKTQIGNTTKQVQTIENELAEKEASINDNPFISEGLRSKQILKARDLSDRKKDALINRLRLDESLYEKGIEQAKFVAQQAMTLTHQQKQTQQDYLFKALDIAIKEAESRRKLKEPLKPTSELQEYNFAVSQGFKESFLGYKQAVAAAGRKPEGMEPNKLLTVDEAIKLGVPFGTTRGQVKGVQPFTTKQRELKTAFAPARVLLNQIETLSKKVNVGKGGIGRFIAGGKAQLGATLQTNPDAALFEAQKSKLSLLVRALGEKGTLATQDVERVRQGLPTLFDSKVVAERKIKELRDFISAVEKQTVQSFGQTEQLDDIFGE